VKTSLTKSSIFSPRLEKVFLGGAAAIGAFFLIRAGVSFAEPSRAYQTDFKTGQKTVSAAITRVPSRAAIDLNFDPFHRRRVDEAVDTPAPVLIGEDAPETDLNITLKGRRASGEGRGSAILLLPDGQEKTITQGDEVIRDVTLEAVYPTHIIISRKGTQERLTFERAAGLLSAAEEAPPVSPQARSAPKSAALKAQKPAKAINSRTSDIKKGNAAPLNTKARDLLSSLRPAPVQVNGQFIGYRLAGAAGAAQLAQFGFESSDIITQINGQNVPQRLSDLSQLLTQLSENPAASSFTVLRKGQKLTLSLN
jgi:type II secretion system protein C